MRSALQSLERLLFKSLDLSEMSVPLDTSAIAVSPTMSMTASIFTLVCISNILYMIYQTTDGLQQGRLAGSGAQIFPKMPHVHLLPQAQELTTSSSTAARGLGHTRSRRLGGLARDRTQPCPQDQEVRHHEPGPLGGLLRGQRVDGTATGVRRGPEHRHELWDADRVQS